MLIKRNFPLVRTLLLLFVSVCFILGGYEFYHDYSQGLIKVPGWISDRCPRNLKYPEYGFTARCPRGLKTTINDGSNFPGWRIVMYPKHDIDDANKVAQISSYYNDGVVVREKKETNIEIDGHKGLEYLGGSGNYAISFLDSDNKTTQLILYTKTEGSLEEVKGSLSDTQKEILDSFRIIK